MGDSSDDRNAADGEVPQHRVTVDAFSIDVTTVTNNDFARFVDDTGYRTEAEWEYASRGGLDQTKYPRGDDEVDAGGWRANIWQGEFPRHNTLDDGYLTTAPVRTFEPNGYGLFQTVGNVWEWCSDWFSANYYAESPAKRGRAVNSVAL